MLRPEWLMCSEKPQRPHREASRSCLLQIRSTVISHLGGKNFVCLEINTNSLQTFQEILSFVKRKAGMCLLRDFSILPFFPTSS